MLVRTINFYYRQDVYAETNLQLKFYYARVKINTESSPLVSPLSSPLWPQWSAFLYPSKWRGSRPATKSGGALDPPPKWAGHNSLNRYNTGESLYQTPRVTWYQDTLGELVPEHPE